MASAAASLLDAETFAASISRDALGPAISPEGSEVLYARETRRGVGFTSAVLAASISMLLACQHPAIPHDTKLGNPQLAQVTGRPSSAILCVEPLTTSSLGVSEGVFLVFEHERAVAMVRLAGDGLECGIGRDGYGFETVAGDVPPGGGEFAVGPLHWQLTGHERYVWVGSPNWLGLGPTDVFLLDLDEDALAEFKVVVLHEEACFHFWALVRFGGPSEWRATGEGGMQC